MTPENILFKISLIFLKYFSSLLMNPAKEECRQTERNTSFTRILAVLSILSFICLNLEAQTYTLGPAIHLTTINTCSGTFYDSGGQFGNYGPSENYQVTFCSSSGENIRFSFHDVFIRLGDELKIYDGPDITAPLLGTYFGGTVSPSAVPDFVVTSSGTCLTFTFQSDLFFDRAGWIADISCILCPPIVTTPILPSSVEECAGTTINYSVVDHPGSIYTWTVEHGTPTSFTGSNNVDVTWDLPGNVTAIIRVDEESACGSKSFSKLDIDIYPLPTPSITGDAEVCPNASGVSYSTLLVAGNTYDWTVTGGTFSVITDNEISVNWGSIDPGNVHLKETSPTGCFADVDFSVQVHDVVPPVISGCPTDINSICGAGVCTANVSWIDPSALDGCDGSMTYTTRSHVPGSVFGVGTTAVTYTFKDAADNISTCVFNVIVTEAEVPVAVCKDISITLDTFGNASISGADVDGGSTDNCGIASLAAFPNSFDITNVGPNNVILTVTDISGNSSTCNAVVTVLANNPPVAICKDITVYLDATGNISITGTDIDNGSSDPDGDPISFDVAPKDFTCANIGPNNVTLTVTDPGGKSSSCNSVVTVVDNTLPVITCPGNMNTFTDPGVCGAVVNYITPVGIDNCSQITSQTAGLPSGSVFPKGATINTFQSVDGSGNIATCSFTITVTDNEKPVISLPVPPVINSGAGCLAPVPAIAATFTDNCTPLGSLIITQVPVAGTMVSTGITVVTITATDQSGNSASSNIDVTVVDGTAPIIVSPADITTNLDASCQATVPDFLSTLIVTDNCTAPGAIIKTQTPVAGSIIAGVSSTNVLIEATDAGGNKSGVTVLFITQDVTLPVMACNNINLSLDATGNATLNPSDIDNGSTDNCSPSLNLTLDKSAFSCADIGAPVPVTLTGIDASLNSATCVSNVTVLDDVIPVVNVKTFNLILGPTGTATLLPADVDNGSFDNCGPITLSVAPNTFGCGDQGLNNVTLTALDSHGNSNSKNIDITVSSDLKFTSGPGLSSCDLAAPFALYSSTVTGGDGTYTYLWDGLDNSVNPFVSFDGVFPFIHFTNTSNAQAPFFNNLMPDGVYNIMLTVWDGNGCSVSDVFVLNKDAGLVFNNVTLKSSEACIGDTKTYSVAAGSTSYAWNITNGIILTPTNTNTVDVLWTGASPGKLVVNIIKDDLLGNSCGSSVEETVTINPVPTPAFNSPVVTVCANSEYTYTLTNTYTSHAWTVVNGVKTGGGGAADNYVKVLWGALAAGSVTADVTNANNCSQSVTTNVTINANPIPSLTSSDIDNTFCAGTNVTFTAGGGSNYNFRVNSISVQNSGSNVYSTSTLTNGQVVDVIVSNVSGCSATSAGITNTVIAFPVVTLSSSDADNTFCAGTSVMFTASGGTTFNFRINSVSVQNSVVPTFTTTALLNGDVVDVIVTNAAGCSTTSGSISNIVVASPTPTITSSDADNSFCAGTSVTFTANGGGTNFNFRVDGITVQNDVLDTYTTTVLTNGQKVDVVVTNATGCIGTSAEITNTVVALPNATITSSDADNMICAGTSVTFTAVAGSTNYDFRVNGTTVQNSGSNIYTTNTLNNGQIVNVIVSVGGGCSATSSDITMTVSALPAASIIYAGTPYCSTTGGGQAVTLTGSSGGTYTSFPAGLSIDPVTGAINPSSSTPGPYTVTYTIPAAGGCGDVTATAPVTITPIPLASFTYSGTPYCSNEVNPLPDLGGGSIAGTFSSTLGLVFISTATGEVNLSLSTPGNYFVTNTILAGGGCGNVSASTPITITALPNPIINYAGSPFCSTVSIGQPVTLSGTGAYTGGIYSSTAGLAINSSTGDITPSTSTPGTYTVTYTVSPVGCAPVQTTTSVTITQIPSATISYSGSPFCKTLAAPQNVTLTGTSGGSFTASPAGLALNAATGAITPSASAVGVYTVTYTLAAAGGCPSVPVTTSVTITAAPTASINYIGAPFCTSIAGTRSVTLTGTGNYSGGTYSAPIGLTLNTTTGAITPSSSTAGTYTVTYVTPASGGCSSVSATTSVTITAAPSATISYGGNPFCTTVSTSQAVTLTGTAGGIFTALPAVGLTLDSGTGAIVPSTSTPATYTITYTIPASGGCALFSTSVNVTITQLPTVSISYAGNPFCVSLVAPQPVTLTGTGAYLLGTFSSDPGLTIDGVSGVITPSSSTPNTYTVTYTTPASGGCASVSATTTVTISALPTAAISYTGSPWCSSAGVQGVTLVGTSGGVYSATPAGLSINAVTGDITPGTSTAGTYIVTYDTPASGGCSSVSATTSVTITALPTATISYAGNPFCKTAGAGQPVTLTGTAGGSYSASPAGLTIDGVTGAVNPGTSTAGVYTVTYTIAAADGCGIVTATAPVTITALPVATFNYAATPYCNSLANPSPSFSGGGVAGTFSSTAGLVFVSAATGEVNLTASTPGSYTVTNTIAASGGCGIVSSTSPITITALPTAAISYAGSPWCSSAGVQGVTLVGTSGGVYSAAPAGLSINSGSGAITPGTSTAGTYTVTYTLAAAGGCGIVSATTSVTITEAPSATISYGGNPFCTTVSTPQPVTLAGTAGGIFTALPAVGLTIDSGTGDIIPSTSTPATYTVTYTVAASGGCALFSSSVNITITQLPTAAITYAGNPFCISLVAPQPVTLTGTGAYLLGTFSSDPGMTIDATSGVITPSTSTTGVHTVTYTAPASGGCASVSTSTIVSVTEVPTATISYSGPFCTSLAASQSVTLTGSGSFAGGTYSSAPVGLTINSTTGDITPSSSTAGTYTVTYDIPASGGCSSVSTSTTVLITELPTASISYSGPFCTSLVAQQSVTLTGSGSFASGTYSSAPVGLTINSTTGAITPSSSTAGTYTVTYDIPASGGCSPVSTNTTVIITDPPTASIIYSGPFCTSLAAPQSVALTGSGSFAGGTYSSSPVGLTINSTTGDITPSSSTAGTYTVTYDIPASGGCSSVSTSTTVIISEIPTASISYSGNPFCKSLITAQMVTLTGTGAYIGGSFSSTLGLDLDPFTGDINPGASNAGTYTVAYISPASGGCSSIIVTTTVTITDIPTATISYAGNPYCSTTGAGQSVTLTGTSGGSYSSIPAGLSLDAVTGSINPSLSTPGVYTITYTIAPAGGCALFSTNASVTITAIPSATISYAGDPYCKSDPAIKPVTLTGTPGGTYSALAGLTLDALTGDVEPATSSPGTYIVTYTVAPAGGCIAVSSTASVTIRPLVTLLITDPLAACSPATIDITDEAVTAGSDVGLTFTYWTDAIATTAYATPLTATPGTYYIKGTDGAGCYDIKPVVVTVNPVPGITITDPSAVCSPATVDITDAAVTAGSDVGLTFTYWTDAIATTAYVTPATATSGTYYIKGTDGVGCYDIKPVVVTVNPVPVVTITDPSAVCSPAVVDITDAAVTAGSDAGLTFSYWTDAIATTAYSTPLTATPGTYYIKGTDGAGCYDIKPVVVTVNPLPVVTITDPLAVCSPGTVDITDAAVTAGSDAGLTYTYWTDAAASSAYTTETAATEGIYYIKGTDVTGCYDIKPVIVTINPIPTISSAQTDILCFGSLAGAIDITAAGGTGPYTYAWTGAGVAATDEDQTGLAGGPYSVIVTDANSCSSASVPFTINEPGSAVSGSITSQTDVSVNGGNDGTVTVSGSGGTSPYQYSLDGGSYQVSGTFGTLTAASYTVTVQDVNLCTFDVAVTIAEPAASLGGTITSQTDVACFGAATGSVTVTGTGGVTPYEYSLDGGTYQASGTFGALASGTYTVTVRDFALSIFDVAVTISQPASAVGGSIISQTDVQCFGSSTGIITVAGSGGTAPYQYSINGGTYQVSGTFEALASNSYAITVQDANLCTFDIIATIAEPAVALTGSIITQTNITCFGAEIGDVSIAGAGGVSPYEYSLDGGAYQASGIFNGLAAASYTVTVRDANLCTIIVPVTITEAPVLSIAQTTVSASCPGEPDGSITLTITGGTQPYTALWDDGTISTNRLNIADGSYSVVVTDFNGCAASLDIIVEFRGSDGCIEVPQVITPNNDGYNDTWKIKNIDLFPDAEVFVFSRWGKLVFRTKNISANEWDGKLKGKLLPTDSYHYILHLNDGSEPKSGVISIIK